MPTYGYIYDEICSAYSVIANMSMANHSLNCDLMSASYGIVENIKIIFTLYY
jgi:hypothetical protein